jgi:metal-responsive CopG/Arc/MetJ family transcriptional regulator
VSDADEWAAHTFLQRRSELNEECKRILVAIADDVERDAEAAIAGTLARHRRAAASIAEAHTQIAALLRGVSTVRRAVDRNAETVTASRSDVIAAALGERQLVSSATTSHRGEDPARQGVVVNASAEGYGETQPAVRDGFVRR